MCYRLGFSKDVGELGLTGIESRKSEAFLHLCKLIYLEKFFVCYLEEFFECYLGE